MIDRIKIPEIRKSTYTVRGRKCKKPVGTPYISLRDFDEDGNVVCFVGFWGRHNEPDNREYKFTNWIDSDEFLQSIGCLTNNHSSEKFHEKRRRDLKRIKELKPLRHSLFESELEKFFTEELYDVY
jgi:hypothetical protein